MKVMDVYDFDKNLEERYSKTIFQEGEDEYLGKSHAYSYLHCRNMYKDIGDVMGLESWMFEVDNG